MSGVCAEPVLTGCYESQVAGQTELKVADTATVVANPGNRVFAGQLSVIHNGTASPGTSWWRIGAAGIPRNGTTTGVVVDLGYGPPTGTITAVTLWHGGGAILNDFDGFQSATAQLFDAAGNSLVGPFTMNTVNGGGQQTFPLPGGPVSGVARLRIDNILPWQNVASDVYIREIGLIGPQLRPVIVYSDCGDRAAIDSRTGAPLPAGAVFRDCRGG